MLIEVTVQSEDSSKPKGFSPQTANAQVGDAVFWHNDELLSRNDLPEISHRRPQYQKSGRQRKPGRDQKGDDGKEPVMYLNDH